MLTIDELESLPVFMPFGADVVPVNPDGTAVAPNGVVLRGLVGTHVTFPRQQDTLRAMPLDSIQSWRDEHGEYWRTVMTADGLKKALA